MICTVVVTYNRLECLKMLLIGLENQTRKPDNIIVVNNGSTDGTTEWLTGKQNLSVINQENSGGSGGFHTGVKAAFEMQAEWIWIMDDDVIPRPDCLQVLIAYSGISKCLNPIHLNAQGIVSDEERWFNPESCQIINHKNRSYLNGKKLWFRNIGSFEGMLISRDIVEKIGFPDKRFFIAHDDLIYGYLAHQFTNVAVIADAVIDRQQVNKSSASIYSYFYYTNRNLWILEEYLNRENNELRRYRNRRVVWHFIYEAYKVLRLNEFNNKPKALKTLLKAFKDYRSKKSGKTF
mgnify:CR=1 FL=1